MEEAKVAASKTRPPKFVLPGERSEDYTDYLPRRTHAISCIGILTYYWEWMKTLTGSVSSEDWIKAVKQQFQSVGPQWQSPCSLFLLGDSISK